jgi:hypothetical protein
MMQKPYLAELGRKEGPIARINDEFRSYAAGVGLFSFYEASPTESLGVIVDRESATLGYPNESIALLNANHRGVCRFNSKGNESYQTLRNALASTVNEIITKCK